MADPYLGFRFKVEIDSMTVGGFSEVTTPDSTSDVVEYRAGDDPHPTPQKIAGLVKYGNITLKRGIMEKLDLYTWRKTIEDHGTNGNRRSMSIVMMDDQNQEKARWNLYEAWPVKYKATDLNAKSSEVVLETMELAHQGCVRIL